MVRKQKESNKEIKHKEGKQKRDDMVEDIDSSSFFELATSDRIYVYSLNLHEIQNEILQDYTGDFELIGVMVVVGPVEQKTYNRFKNMDDFESYINEIDIDYDSEDVTFTRCF